MKKSALGQPTTYTYAGANAKLLDRFRNPMVMKGTGYKHIAKVLITAPEFTSLCPLTGQPDFATIVIEYVPSAWCVESKSLKLYLGSFRQHKEFHEACVQRISHNLVCLLHPDWLKVEGRFTPRGGIPFWPTVEYERT